MTANLNITSIDATIKLVHAYLQNNKVPYDKFASFIRGVNSAVIEIVNPGAAAASAEPPLAAAAPVGTEVDELVISVEDAAAEPVTKAAPTRKSRRPAQVSGDTRAEPEDVADAAEIAAPAEAKVEPETEGAVESDAVPASVPDGTTRPDTTMTLEEARAIVAARRPRGRPSREYLTAKNLVDCARHDAEHKASAKQPGETPTPEAPLWQGIEAEVPKKRRGGRLAKAAQAERVTEDVSPGVEPGESVLVEKEPTVLLKKGTVVIDRDAGEAPQEAPQPRSRRERPSPQEIREYSSQGGLSDDPDAPNYRFAILERAPVVPINGSYTDEFVTCLLDGVKRKVLKRHLETRYSMTEAQYRRHFNLPRDFPTVAPAYARERSAIAKQRNLGKKRDDGFFKNREGTRLPRRSRGAGT